MTIITTSALTFLMLLATPTGAPAWDRGKVERFATLPPGEKYPEGIEVDEDGTVYVATTAVNKADTSAGTLFVFDSQGKLLRQVNITGF
jgi:DNA-binding beta-propeller fold protein YncE